MSNDEKVELHKARAENLKPTSRKEIEAIAAKQKAYAGMSAQPRRVLIGQVEPTNTDMDNLKNDKNYKPVKQLHNGDTVTQVFLISGVSKGTTKRGDAFATFTLQDQSGKLYCKQWQFDPSEYPEIKAGIYAKMTISVEEYQGSLQAKSKTIPMPVEPPKDVSRYESSMGLAPDKAQRYYDELMKIKDEVEDPYIKAYLDTIFEENFVVKKLFTTAPASVSNRGAYRGGLVEHVYKVMKNALAIVASQSEANMPTPVNRDIVIAGVLAHDLGKMYAYSVDSTGVHHTRSGLLLAHLPLSYSISVQAFIQAESALRREIPEETKDHINHCILAHHGQLEYGSPVKPQSLEAQIVHVADMADSTASNFAEVTLAGIGKQNDDGFADGNFFSAKTVYVGDKNLDESSS